MYTRETESKVVVNRLAFGMRQSLDRKEITLETKFAMQIRYVPTIVVLYPRMIRPF